MNPGKENTVIHRSSEAFLAKINRSLPTAVPRLLYSETTSLKWHFPQENATLHDAREGTCIVEPL
jgi:hypothetical protein